MTLLVALLLAAAPAGDNAPPQRAGDCRWVHGRYAIYNGAGVRRIWVIGTRRIINLLDDDDDIPPEIRRYQNAAPYYGFEDALYGDFYVCARANSRPGWMQPVRLLRTRNLIFRNRPYQRRQSAYPLPGRRRDL